MKQRIVSGVVLAAIGGFLTTLWTQEPYGMGAAGVLLGSGVTLLGQGLGSMLFKPTFKRR